MHFEIVGDIIQVETIAVGRRLRDLPRLQRTYGRGQWRKLKGIALIRVRTEKYERRSCTGMRRMALVERKSNASATLTRAGKKRRRSAVEFAVCVNNSEYPASLELHKIYRVVADEEAPREGDLRIIDESGEDYLYPAEWFVPVELPPRVRGSLLRMP